MRLMLNGIATFISSFAVVEIGVAIVLLLSGFGLPVPEDIPLLLGGFFCSEAGGSLSRLIVMIPLTYGAVMTADLMVFWLGWRYGQQVIALPILNHLLSPARLEKAEQTFARHGGKTLFAARFMPGLRSAVFIAAGICRTPRWKMVVFDGTAALLSVPLWVLAGYYFGENIPDVLHFASHVKGILFGLAAAAVLSYVLYRLRQHRLREKPQTDGRRLMPSKVEPDSAGDAGL
jgi:membrane protein DedA with SNARE-associated domain